MATAHDQAMQQLVRAAKTLTLADAADAFLASLSARELTWRAPLDAVVIARHLPAHQYVRQTRYSSGDTCGVCGFDAVSEEYGQSPGRLARLIEALGTQRPRPTAADVKIFNGILLQVAEQQRLSIDGRVRRAELMKALSPVFKSDKYERMALLDTLGRCSVLATPEHPGFLRRFVPHDERGHGSGNNDFEWPFALWTAAHGIDAAAVRELFPHPGIVVPTGAPIPASFDEPKARAELERLSVRQRGDDRIARVLFAPGGLWIALLTDGRHALLTKAARRWRWVTGSREDVLASVPDAMFASAVAALGPTEG